jgi:NADH:ubiquinone oxidoreductase subunit F (NADH-binding)
MRHDPHLLIEGCLIAGFAMAAHTCYIHVRGEFVRERERLQPAVDEAYEASLIGKDNVHGWDFDMVIHQGPAPTSVARKPRCWKALRARRACRGSDRRTQLM